ncbi:MAG: Hsp70 family protein [Chlamydiales bacterium]|nr:Hsp70 family protein [Chlamydiia bacterium]MCP5506754.1 Hsp70 family protein [Chlamydiales bacterium]
MSGIIGIDLGTTNCTLAYGNEGKIQQFSIAQIVSGGMQDNQFSLPSFLYFPLQEELQKKVAAIDWDLERLFCVGKYARDRGAELPDRMVSSAKSWLCHGDLDKREPFLPLHASDDLQKVSPVQACADLLKHLREAWDNENGDTPFAEQQVLITVPASFDPEARQLVQDAAEQAGYLGVTLLEEPQAAFYAWLQSQGDSWRDHLSVGDQVLVIDIGGGTTDFSLISVEDNDGDLQLNRIAVGAHLLLGGDNIDLSLAYLAKDQLEEQGHEIDEWQLQALLHGCRQAKETLMCADAVESVDITIMGRGSSLIGGTLTTTLTRDAVVGMVLEAFIPKVGPEERSTFEKRSGMRQVGLPYVHDARISCQLAKFLSMTGEDDSMSMDNFVMPTAVLFNGGTMKADALRSAVVDLLNSWAEKLGKDPVKVLPGEDLDYAVSRGAVAYGFARAGQSIRIKSGTSRSYYIGIEEALPAVPGREAPLKAVCIVPYGMEEGTEQELEGQEFSLVVGESATFRFFSHAAPTLNDGNEPKVGAVIRRWKQELSELHPIESCLEGANGDDKTIRVKLKSRITELGMLELWCVADDGRQWKLEFNVREEPVLLAL